MKDTALKKSIPHEFVELRYQVVLNNVERISVTQLDLGIRKRTFTSHKFQFKNDDSRAI